MWGWWCKTAVMPWWCGDRLKEGGGRGLMVESSEAVREGK